MLVAGNQFLRRLVEILPGFKEKRQAVDIFQQVESDISGYLVTITLMNATVGIATAVVTWPLGRGRFPAELRTDPWPYLRGGNLSPRWPVDH